MKVLTASNPAAGLWSLAFKDKLRALRAIVLAQLQSRRKIKAYQQLRYCLFTSRLLLMHVLLPLQSQPLHREWWRRCDGGLHQNRTILCTNPSRVRRFPHGALSDARNTAHVHASILRRMRGEADTTLVPPAKRDEAVSLSPFAQKLSESLK
jgi:hypothetical protein